MVMLLQILAAALLLLGSGLIFYALLSLERGSRPASRRLSQARESVSGDRELPRAA
jgi:hypothetical protein